MRKFSNPTEKKDTLHIGKQRQGRQQIYYLKNMRRQWINIFQSILKMATWICMSKEMSFKNKIEIKTYKSKKNSSLADPHYKKC